MLKYGLEQTWTDSWVKMLCYSGIKDNSMSGNFPYACKRKLQQIGISVYFKIIIGVFERLNLPRNLGINSESQVI